MSSREARRRSRENYSDRGGRTVGNGKRENTENNKRNKSGNKRKLSEEATRRLTRQRRGVDKMGGVMIHRIERK